jgi:hypothetical protein
LGLSLTLRLGRAVERRERKNQRGAQRHGNAAPPDAAEPAHCPH